jgi:ABC-type amino acid transport substrate-binding protein
MRHTHGYSLAGWLLLLVIVLPGVSTARDLEDVRADGVLRHLGVPYANFVTGSGDGLDVELMQGFAKHLGVRYEYVETDWKRVIPDLSGMQVRAKDGKAEVLGEAPVRGDVIANGLTILPWRQEVVAYAEPTFPSGVWLIAQAEHDIKPIRASGDQLVDVGTVKGLMHAQDVLTMPNTCLDADLYGLDQTGARVEIYDRSTNLNEMVPAILGGQMTSRMTLLDVPDALIALQKWPGRIKVIGPVSGEQFMAPAFAKDAPGLREAFNAYMAELRADGRYRTMVEKYYPAVFLHFPEFFDKRG